MNNTNVQNLSHNLQAFYKKMLTRRNACQDEISRVKPFPAPYYEGMVEAYNQQLCVLAAVLEASGINVLLDTPQTAPVEKAVDSTPVNSNQYNDFIYQMEEGL